MPDFEKLYHFLFNIVTDIVEGGFDADTMRQKLKEGQMECERKYIEEDYN